MYTILRTVFIILVFLCSSSVFAQHVYFPYEGTVTYDKTVFIKNLMKRYSSYEKDPGKGNFYSSFLENAAESHVFKKTLSFKTNETLFQQVKEVYPEHIRAIATMGIIESGTSVYQNLKTKEFRSAFEIGGQDVYVTDSIVHTKWKITNEYRNIAGYNCRRANGIVLDSIYVIAFYTDEIPVSSGPSCFNGLPGLILGVAVPELHYNIFASKVDLTPVPYIDPNIAKKKAKPTNRKGIYEQLHTVIGGYLGEKVFNLVMAGFYL